MGLPQAKVAANPPLTVNELARLMPFDRLAPDRLYELVKHVRVDNLPAGCRLFSRGEHNDKAIYLLSGEVELVVNQARTAIHSQTPQARQPLDPHQPRHFTAIAKTAIQIVQIDRNLIDIFVSRDHCSGYIVKEIDDADENVEDWMEVILKSKIFHKVPPVNIKTMFDKLQVMPMRKGEIVFRQGQDGDYFYIIRSGGCAVLRMDDEEEGWRLIAELGPGQSFGEEALLSDRPRNATIQMAADGTLLRLSRQDFNALLKTPIVKTVNFVNACELVKRGVIWLDVRSEVEHQRWALPGSLHVPFSAMRESIAALPAGQPFIVYCDNGQQSASAAYLLNAQGYQALVLEGGIQAIINEH